MHEGCKIVMVIMKILVVFHFLCVAIASEVSHDLNDVHFFLYSERSNKNYSEELIFNNTSSIESSKFKKRELTVFFIHGFGVNRTAFRETKDAYLQSSDNRISSANLILVDWSKLGSPPLTPIDLVLGYLETLSNISPVGGRIGDFILWLNSTAYIQTDRVHVVGHSAGAHVAGAVGKRVKSKSSGKLTIARITGLDAAGPFFSPVAAPGIIPLKKDDASFVDAIHTSAGTLGSSTMDGVAAFYPNGGTHQTGCNDFNATLILPFTCSHLYAIELYTASVSKEYYGCQCAHPSLGIEEVIGLRSCLKPCRNPSLLGPFCPITAKGKFYLKTPNPP